jgi:hypothetical protein
MSPPDDEPCRRSGCICRLTQALGVSACCAELDQTVSCAERQAIVRGYGRDLLCYVMPWLGGRRCFRGNKHGGASQVNQTPQVATFRYRSWLGTAEWPYS